MLQEYVGCTAQETETVYSNLLPNLIDGEKDVSSDHIPATP